MIEFGGGIVLGLVAGIFITLNNTKRIRNEIQALRDTIDALRRRLS